MSNLLISIEKKRFGLNFWQMDSRTGAMPDEGMQLNLFDEPPEDVPRGTPCKIYNWRSRKLMTFDEMKGGFIQ